MAEPVPTSDSPDSMVGNKSPDARERVGDRLVPRAEPGAGLDIQTIADYVGRLSEEHKMLLALKVQLYGGSWEPMLDDLRNRLAGKPYIFKLVHRIQDDIGRIEAMQKFEAEHQIDLAEYVDG